MRETKKYHSFVYKKQHTVLIPIDFNEAKLLNMIFESSSNEDSTIRMLIFGDNCKETRTFRDMICLLI